MAKKFDEYNRGRMQGLEMAYRMLKEAGNNAGMELIGEEIRKRGKLPREAQLPVTTKELEHGLEPIKWCMYESFMCQALMVLRDQFGFGKSRCMKFIKRWNYKADCMGEGLVNWSDYISTIKEELDIDVPVACMKEEGLI